uniref:ATP synthase F0 subunit 8 n=1 Tax=Moramonas marocensis TaxID=1805496 RepID=A0A140F2K8_9EUKA|nr:ATP synthase F0 subunit 8 [Moramonas marocensis]
MPQLDKVTFFSQFFWLLVFFLSFYLLSLKIILPSISTLLKIRKKKIDRIHSDIRLLKGEESGLSEDHDRILLDSFHESRKVIHNLLSYNQEWMSHSNRDINQSSLSLLNANKAYLSSLKDIKMDEFMFNKVFDTSK